MNGENKKIAVYGAGAMGTVLGSLLSESRGGNTVDLVSRNRAHIEAMKKTGAHIVCKADSREFTTKVNALFPEEMTENYDVVFLMTKQKENGEIAEFLKGRLAENGVVCTSQNGLPEESLARVLGEEKVYGAVCAWGATFVGGGTAELTSQRSAMTMQIGGCASKADRADAVREILSRCGISVSVTENLSGVRWSKLAINAAFSGLSVLTGLTFGEIARRRGTRRFALEILRECFSVASASGVTLEKMQGHDMEKLLGQKGFFGTQKALFVLPIAMRKHKNLVSGMLKDIEKGRKCEIDYITGAVCRQGDKFGVETPLCDRVTEIAHGIENGLYEISYKNIEFF